VKWADDNLDLLQNMELSVVEIWRAHPEMSDHVALRAYEAAFQFYRAEPRGHTPKPHALTGLDAATFDAVRAMCDFRLARGHCPVPGPADMPAIPLQEIVDCLRGLSKFVARHTKLGSRQGSLTFIEGFLK
jgi:hypothetical protein